MLTADVMRNRHQPTAAKILGRPNPTWSDCLEMAEVCLHHMHRRGPFDRSDPMAALVWAVLSAGGIDEVFVPEVGDLELEQGPEALW